MTLCDTVPNLKKGSWENRFAWVIHGNVIQILNRESLGDAEFADRPTLPPPGTNAHDPRGRFASHVGGE